MRTRPQKENDEKGKKKKNDRNVLCMNTQYIKLLASRPQLSEVERGVGGSDVG